MGADVIRPRKPAMPMKGSLFGRNPMIERLMGAKISLPSETWSPSGGPDSRSCQKKSPLTPARTDVSSSFTRSTIWRTVSLPRALMLRMWKPLVRMSILATCAMTPSLAYRAYWMPGAMGVLSSISAADPPSGRAKQARMRTAAGKRVIFRISGIGKSSA